MTNSLVFNSRSKEFRVRISQDYETQAKIETRYTDADAYLAEHPEYQDTAKGAIREHIANEPEHEEAMRAALRRMKNL